MSDDRSALEALRQASDLGTPHIIAHYLYVPSKAAAAEVAARLRSHGFTMEQRLGADGVNWLVLAKHEIVPTDLAISAARCFMEGLVAPVAGEYDGWEAAVSQP